MQGLCTCVHVSEARASFPVSLYQEVQQAALQIPAPLAELK